MDAEFVPECKALLRNLAGLTESSMRVAALADALVSCGDLRAVWLLEWLLRQALAKDRAASLVYDGLIDPDALSAQVGNERLNHWVTVGREQGCFAALLWLLGPGAASADGELEPDGLVDKSLRRLTLGERRALARRARADLLDRLLADPDPEVIHNLLNNPRTTESVVLRICSRRPTISAPLEAVLRTPRWRQRYSVKVALCKNPHLRAGYAINLLFCLNRKDLCAIAADQTLVEAVQEAAGQLLGLGRLPAG